MKCKFFYKCKFVQPDGFTCNHEEEADGYCGWYKTLEMMQFKIKKKDL